MSNNDKAGSLLSTLRAQSEALRAQGVTARPPIEVTQREMDRRLWRAFRWLEEALNHLEVIHPAVGHRFHLGNLLHVDRPQFERGFVTYRRRAVGGQELLEHVELFYNLRGSEPIALRVNPAAAGSVEERLRSSTLPFHYQTEQDERRVVRHGVFTVTPAIAASVRFQPDYRELTIDVTLHNVDRFEPVSLAFEGPSLDETALEDLLRLILGESNTFLRRAPLVGMRNGHAPAAPQARARPMPINGEATVPDFGMRR